LYPGFNLQGTLSNATNDDGWLYTTQHVAAGDDFNLYFFVNTPVFFFYSDPQGAPV